MAVFALLSAAVGRSVGHSTKAEKFVKLAVSRMPTMMMREEGGQRRQRNRRRRAPKSRRTGGRRERGPRIYCKHRKGRTRNNAHDDDEARASFLGHVPKLLEIPQRGTAIYLCSLLILIKEFLTFHPFHQVCRIFILSRPWPRIEMKLTPFRYWVCGHCGPAGAAHSVVRYETKDHFPQGPSARYFQIATHFHIAEHKFMPLPHP